MARFDMRCPRCALVTETGAPIGKTPVVRCPNCEVLMEVYFGKRSAQPNPINFGFRPQNYATEEDRRIGQYQFTHLMKD